ncbi:MAG: DUF4476 domain-containing protein [Bacteroidia bacterium]
MKFLFLFLFAFITICGLAQNDVRIFSDKGALFIISTSDSVQNKTAQTNVLIRSIYEDTVRIKLEFEDKQKLETTLFLFEKGLPTKNKEFNYKISREQNKIKLSYSGYYDVTRLPSPLVPAKPIIDTNAKYKNTRLAHFCELKDNKPSYFNNIPKDGDCTSGMPPEYLNYINLLMLKAQIADDKYIIAENVCRNNCLTTEQLNFILKYIEYEIEKLKLIKIAYFNLTDKNNKKELEKSFRFESSVLELNNFFKSAVDPKMLANNNCKIASAEEDIKKIKEELNVYTNDATRFQTFKKIYETYCYSKDQILIILNLFIHDREKLDAAKLLYFRCMEKENFLLISEVFSYNETISELKDFVAKQKG